MGELRVKRLEWEAIDGGIRLRAQSAVGLYEVGLNPEHRPDWRGPYWRDPDHLYHQVASDDAAKAAAQADYDARIRSAIEAS